MKYGRAHSMTLWHTDRFFLDEAWGSLRGRWLILIEDDASRLIPGCGVHETPTAEDTIEAFQEAFKRHGVAREALTDRGSQFYANAGLRRASGVTAFEAFLHRSRVKHIVGRVSHPQANGKVERLYRTLREKARLFPSMEERVRLYNELKPHLSLDLTSRGPRRLRKPTSERCLRRYEDLRKKTHPRGAEISGYYRQQIVGMWLLKSVWELERLPTPRASFTSRFSITYVLSSSPLKLGREPRC